MKIFTQGILARRKAHLRREQRGTRSIPDIFTFGDVEIDFNHLKIRRKDRENILYRGS